MCFKISRPYEETREKALQEAAIVALSNALKDLKNLKNRGRDVFSYIQELYQWEGLQYFNAETLQSQANNKKKSVEKKMSIDTGS